MHLGARDVSEPLSQALGLNNATLEIRTKTSAIETLDSEPRTGDAINFWTFSNDPLHVVRDPHPGQTPGTLPSNRTRPGGTVDGAGCHCS